MIPAPAIILKTSVMALLDCLMLLVVSVIPLAVLELVKCGRNQQRNRASAGEYFQGIPTV